VRVRCSGCGYSYLLSTRRARDHRIRGTQPECRECRLARSVQVQVTEAMRRYWLDRFSLEEIQELAAAFDTISAT
jgi:hypothetical protein